MGMSKNSRSRPAASDAKPPQTPHAPTPELPFRNAGVPPAPLQPIISIPASPSPQFLIANPELESPATPTKQTIEAKSNRKKIAILHQEFRRGGGGLPTTRHPSLITRFLIETPRLELLVTPVNTITSQFLIETKRPFPIAEFVLPCLPGPSMIIFNSIVI
jgi:hypothetical protein